MNEEARRLDVELFADVFADLDEFAATGAARAGFGFVPMFDARQFGRQRIATTALVRARHFGRVLLFFQLNDDGRTILVAGLEKEIALLSSQRFALTAEANALEVSQFEGELLDLQIAPFEFGVEGDKLRLQSVDFCLNQGWISGFLGRFNDRMHGAYFTTKTSPKPCQY
jgi:hypothetical protein